MTRTLNSRQWTGNHLSPTVTAPSQQIEVEAVYFIEIAANAIHINCEPTDITGHDAQTIMTIIERDYAHRETLSDSGVYRLTYNEVVAVGKQARKAVSEPRRDAQTPPSTIDATCGADCDLCQFADACQDEAQAIAEWRDDFESQARPGAF